jgi:hypothetical protein
MKKSLSVPTSLDAWLAVTAASTRFSWLIVSAGQAKTAGLLRRFLKAWY